jgi:hypothetical protein
MALSQKSRSHLASFGEGGGGTTHSGQLAQARLVKVHLVRLRIRVRGRDRVRIRVRVTFRVRVRLG